MPPMQDVCGTIPSKRCRATPDATFGRKALSKHKNLLSEPCRCYLRTEDCSKEHSRITFRNELLMRIAWHWQPHAIISAASLPPTSWCRGCGERPVNVRVAAPQRALLLAMLDTGSVAASHSHTIRHSKIILAHVQGSTDSTPAAPRDNTSNSALRQHGGRALAEDPR